MLKGGLQTSTAKSTKIGYADKLTLKTFGLISALEQWASNQQKFVRAKTVFFGRSYASAFAELLLCGNYRNISIAFTRLN
jgi:hypothetical protein